MNRWRLDIAYDGTDFSGWACQPGRRTVQGVLQDALSTVLRGPVRLTVAGRTDAGVHAHGQVAHFDHETEIEPAAMVHRLAKFLPKDVRILKITPVPPEFDARFAALRRHYRYRLSTAPYGVDPLERRTVVSCRARDVVAMQQASQTLLGLHDFAAFCRPRPGATTIRDLQRFDWQLDGYHLDAYVTADAFCWSMVRSLVGAVIALGENRRTPEWLVGLLAENHRSPDIPVAPAHGLTLIGVDYPPESEWSHRIAQTTHLRQSPEPCCGE